MPLSLCSDAPVVLVSSDSGFTSGRILTGGPGISVTDGGAGNGVTVRSFSALDYQVAQSSVAMDGTEKTLYTYTLPGGTMLAGKGVRVTMMFHHSTGSANVTYRVYFGSTLQLFGLSGTTMGKFVVVVFNNLGSTTAQQMTFTDGFVGSALVSLPTAVLTPAEDTANSVVVKFTAAAPPTDAVTPKLWIAELV